MEPYDEVAAREDAEDAALESEQEQLLSVLESRRRWSWLPWKTPDESIVGAIYFEESRSHYLTPKRCWRIQGTNFYLTEHCYVVYCDNNQQLVATGRDYLRRSGQIVPLTNAMRRMRKTLTGKRD